VKSKVWENQHKETMLLPSRVQQWKRNEGNFYGIGINAFVSSSALMLLVDGNRKGI